MDARFLTRAVSFTVGASSLLWVFACSSGDESLGRDQNATQRGTGGTTAGTTSTGTDPNDCDIIECFRPVECVEQCGGPIGEARLEAMPAARLCITCASARR